MRFLWRLHCGTYTQTQQASYKVNLKCLDWSVAWFSCVSSVQQHFYGTYRTWQTWRHNIYGTCSESHSSLSTKDSITHAATCQWVFQYILVNHMKSTKLWAQKLVHFSSNKITHMFSFFCWYPSDALLDLGFKFLFEFILSCSVISFKVSARICLLALTRLSTFVLLFVVAAVLILCHWEHEILWNSPRRRQTFVATAHKLNFDFAWCMKLSSKWPWTKHVLTNCHKFIARMVDVVYDWAVCSRSLFCWKQ